MSASLFLMNAGADGTASPLASPDCVKVYTTRQVTKAGRPILVVSHDEEDGVWQFHWGGPIRLAELQKVALSRILELDPSLAGLTDLPPGWWAQRSSRDREWVCSPQPAEVEYLRAS
jgi:hypothetical protein